MTKADDLMLHSRLGVKFERVNGNVVCVCPYVNLREVMSVLGWKRVQGLQGMISVKLE